MGGSKEENMQLICESNCLQDYVQETAEVDFSHSSIERYAGRLFHQGQTDIEKIKLAFQAVRDTIAHSWDNQGSRVTCRASEVLELKEGICYAKSNLLAALLRGEGIPVGFCYQRLMLFDKPEKGYCIHALNAVYMESINKWIRLDARGNKPGIEAEFSIDEEYLAFKVDESADELDYPTIYVNPHPITLATLKSHTDAVDMYKHHLPERL